MILEPWMGWAAFLILLLLALSAFFSGSETALTATSRARMLSLEKEKGGPMKKKFELTIVTILIESPALETCFIVFSAFVEWQSGGPIRSDGLLFVL